MESINNLITRPPANQIKDQTNQNKDLVNQSRPKSNLARSSNGQFIKKTVIEDIDEVDVSRDRKILNPKITKLPKDVISRAKRPTKEEYHDYEVVGLGFPINRISLAQMKGKTMNNNLKYKIPVYLKKKGSESSEIILKNVQFGNVKDSDYVDHKNNTERLKFLSRHKPSENFLKAPFYRYYLLNSSNDSIESAFKSLCEILKVVAI